MVHAVSKWFPQRRVVASARARLVCVPYAGGGAAAFRSWSGAFAPDVEVCAVEPPGRGSRFREAPLRSVAAYAHELAGVVRTLADRPFVLFGHSLGALAAFETARRMLEQGGVAPLALVLSGHGPRDRKHEPLHELPQPKLIAKLRAFNGTPPELLENDELMELVLPTLRADFEMVETHRYEAHHRVDRPILAIGGEADPDCPPESIESWGQRTSAPFAWRMFQGDHFFVRSAEADVIPVVRDFIERNLAGR